MSAQDWYARKLGVPSQQEHTYSPPMQRGYPQARQVQPEYTTPNQQPQERVRQQPPAPPEQLGLHNFVQQMGNWRGGQATRNERFPCPSCGGQHFFSRKGGRIPPAPHCFDCGYSGSADMTEVLIPGAPDMNLTGM